jgi:hypothetical protein
MHSHHYTKSDSQVDESVNVAARYGEISPVPRYTSDFIKKYQDRLLYGTDMGTEYDMYTTTFRILETADEHFYETRFHYHCLCMAYG